MNVEAVKTLEARAREAARVLAENEEATEFARQHRDELVAQAVDELEVPTRTVTSWFGISQTTVMRIVSDPDRR